MEHRSYVLPNIETNRNIFTKFVGKSTKKWPHVSQKGKRDYNNKIKLRVVGCADGNFW